MKDPWHDRNKRKRGNRLKVGTTCSECLNPLEIKPPPSSCGEEDKLSPHWDTTLHSLDWQTQKFISLACQDWGQGTVSDFSNGCQSTQLLQVTEWQLSKSQLCSSGSWRLDLPLHLWNCTAHSAAWKSVGGEQEEGVCTVCKGWDWEATEVMHDGEGNEGHLRTNFPWLSGNELLHEARRCNRRPWKARKGPC